MSDPYIVVALISRKCGSHKISDAVISSLISRKYELSTWSGSDTAPTDNKENLLRVINSGGTVSYDKKIGDDKFGGFYEKPDKIGAKSDYWIISLPFSNRILFRDSNEYLNEIEGIVHDLCSRLPVLLLYGTSSFEAEARPEFVDSDIEYLSSISYFSNKVISYNTKKKLIGASVYSATKINNGLYIRIGKNLSSISSSDQKEISNATGLSVNR